MEVEQDNQEKQSKKTDWGYKEEKEFTIKNEPDWDNISNFKNEFEIASQNIKVENEEYNVVEIEQEKQLENIRQTDFLSDKADFYNGYTIARSGFFQSDQNNLLSFYYKTNDAFISEENLQNSNFTANAFEAKDDKGMQEKQIIIKKEPSWDNEDYVQNEPDWNNDINVKHEFEIVNQNIKTEYDDYNVVTIEQDSQLQNDKEFMNDRTYSSDDYHSNANLFFVPNQDNTHFLNKENQAQTNLQTSESIENIFAVKTEENKENDGSQLLISSSVEKDLPPRKIPRPPNAFMIFGQEHRMLLSKQYADENNKMISIRLGKLWKELRQDIKDEYFRKAKYAEEEHRRKYPNYEYNPFVARRNKEIWKAKQNARLISNKRENETIPTIISHLEKDMQSDQHSGKEILHQTSLSNLSNNVESSLEEVPSLSSQCEYSLVQNYNDKHNIYTDNHNSEIQYLKVPGELYNNCILIQEPKHPKFNTSNLQQKDSNINEPIPLFSFVINNQKRENFERSLEENTVLISKEKSAQADNKNENISFQLDKQNHDMEDYATNEQIQKSIYIMNNPALLYCCSQHHQLSSHACSSKSIIFKMDTSKVLKNEICNDNQNIQSSNYICCENNLSQVGIVYEQDGQNITTERLFQSSTDLQIIETEKMGNVLVTNDKQVSPYSSINSLIMKEYDGSQLSMNSSTEKDLPPCKIPRPPNAFMIFGQEHRTLLSKQYANENNKMISIRLGKLWKELRQDIKNEYFLKAKRVEQEHRRKYPNYEYNPFVARRNKEIWKAKQNVKIIPSKKETETLLISTAY